MKKGKFIVFEGLDGSGLSTQASLLTNFLLEKGHKAILTKEQTNGAIGGLVKSCIKGQLKTNLLAIQLLFAADRAHHLSEEILPAVNEGEFVICDRYFFSSLAFGSLDVDRKFLELLNSKFPKPDITFIIDTPPERCLQRIDKSRFSVELFEDIEKFRKIRENYLLIKKSFPNVFVIKGDRSKEEVHKDVKEILDGILDI